MPPCLPRHRAPAQALKRGWTQFILILPQPVSVPGGHDACPTPCSLGSARPPNPVYPNRDTGAGRAHLWQFTDQQEEQQKGTSLDHQPAALGTFCHPGWSLSPRGRQDASSHPLHWEPLFPSCTYHADPLPGQSWVSGASALPRLPVVETPSSPTGCWTA